MGETKRLQITIFEVDLDMAIESNMDGGEFCLDLQTGAVELIVDPDWQDETDEMEEVRKLRDADPSRFLLIEPMPSHVAFEQMESFVEELASEEAQEALREALRRRKPFRQFKDALFDFPDVREEWFKYSAQETMNYAKEWLADQGVDAVYLPGMRPITGA